MASIPLTVLSGFCRGEIQACAPDQRQDQSCAGRRARSATCFNMSTMECQCKQQLFLQESRVRDKQVRLY